MVEQLNLWVTALHPVWQFLAVFVIGVVPFLESYTGTLVGTVTGMPVLLAAAGAVAGNVLALVVAVRLGDRARRGLGRRASRPPSERRQRVIARVDRYGVPVASLLAPTLMAISLTAFGMVAAGLDRRQVMIWQVVAVVVWAALFAAVGLGALSAFG
ncbi:hypothetical protein [Pseudonocardia alni]|jgi:hypothetical protein|uniref:hypothetical protein n=1 Tax=Pseudonocardia alni TaxID=33907 RepID=UPI0015BD29A3|nr:hypothetical protein [Pseudonocardia alni]NWJ74816.1 hypothetical protein [Pseudonocardia pini]